MKKKMPLLIFCLVTLSCGLVFSMISSTQSSQDKVLESRIEVIKSKLGRAKALKKKALMKELAELENKLTESSSADRKDSK